MIRRAFPVLAVALLALGLPSVSAKGRDPVAAAAAGARAQFAADVRDAEGILAAATANLTQALVSGAKTPEEAANGFSAAFSFFVVTVKRRADAASASMATGASQAIVTENDPALRGALAGDGGALDDFSEAMQSSLDATRRRAIGRARKFGKSLASATVRSRLGVSLPPWTFEPRIAPAAPAALAAADDGIRLLSALATRLDDGKVIVAVAGRAPKSASGDFDVRLVAGADVSALGPFLSAGGVTVPDDGTWSALVTLNDPGQGEGEAQGNRMIHFGVDPFDGGLAGRQPGRYAHGGVIGIP
jgi:hypothetical protein